MLFQMSIGALPSKQPYCCHSMAKLNDIRPKSCDLSLIPSAWGGTLAGTADRVGRGGSRPVVGRRKCAVVPVLALENVTIHRLQHLIEEAVHRLSHEVAQLRALPGNDVEHFGQLAIARDLGLVELDPIHRLAGFGTARG